MRIGINTFPLLNGRAGAEQFTHNLLKAFCRTDPSNHYVLLLSRTNRARYWIDAKNFCNVVYPFDARLRLRRILWEQLFLSLHLQRLDLDVLYAPCNVAPAYAPCPLVVTVFDLHWFRLPDLFSASQRLYLRMAISRSLKAAKRVTTLSKHSARDICELFAVPSTKICIIPPGIDPAFRVIQDRSALAGVRIRYGIPGPFALFVGQCLRRKNIARLIRAYAYAKRSRGFPLTLVLAGGSGDGDREVELAIASSGVERSVIRTGEIDQMEDVALLYNAAELVVYPSLYEGFGLPVLEAMACGTPVITGNSSSLPEVAADAALLVDPYDVTGLAEAMTAVLVDKQLRERMRERGLRHAGRYTWEATAAETLAVLREASKPNCIASGAGPSLGS